MSHPPNPIDSHQLVHLGLKDIIVMGYKSPVVDLVILPGPNPEACNFTTMID